MKMVIFEKGEIVNWINGHELVRVEIISGNSYACLVKTLEKCEDYMIGFEVGVLVNYLEKIKKQILKSDIKGYV